MAKKETNAPVTGPDNTGNEKKSRAGTCPSGFYIYIGPNIKKHIQTGTIYRGTRANALKQAAEAIKAYSVPAGQDPYRFRRRAAGGPFEGQGPRQRTVRQLHEAEAGGKGR